MVGIVSIILGTCIMRYFRDISISMSRTFLEYLNTDREIYRDTILVVHVTIYHASAGMTCVFVRFHMKA